MVSSLSLIPCCQKTPPLLTTISPGFRYNLRVNMSISLPPPVRKRRTSTRSTGSCPLLQFSVQYSLPPAHCKFAGFAWLSYDIDFRRKVACSPSINWGKRDIQVYLLKFTGQAKSCCTICGSGDHLFHGCSLSALRPTSLNYH